MCAGVLLFGLTSQAIAADARQEAVVQKGSVEWNAMREKNPSMPTDLSGAALKGRRLRKIDFSQTSLAGADLSQSDFGRSEFRDADLHGAKLDGSVLVGSRFTGANLSQASLAGASCSGADFSGAKMASAVLRRADCGESKLRGADLAGADLREANLEHADLSRADLRAANFWLAKTGGANFTGALISDETVLPNGKTGSAQWASDHGAMFAPVVAASKPEPAGVAGAASPQAVQSAPPSASSQAAPSAAPQKATTLAKTLKPIRAWRPAPSSISYDADQLDQLKSNVTKWNRLRTEKPAMNVRLKEAPLDNRVLAYADLHGADLEKASLKRSDLEKADMNNANLRGADLRSANLQRADLRQADLRGANLWLANTGRAEFEGAIVSSETVLDTGKKATPAWAQEHAARFMDESEPLR